MVLGKIINLVCEQVWRQSIIAFPLFFLIQGVQRFIFTFNLYLRIIHLTRQHFLVWDGMGDFCRLEGVGVWGISGFLVMKPLFLRRKFSRFFLCSIFILFNSLFKIEIMPSTQQCHDNFQMIFFFDSLWLNV